MVFRASTTSLTSLHSFVEPHLLRGVPLHVCLEGWAQHWSQREGGMFNIDERNYELGKETTYYDHFLSHDWATSRWLKLMSMMIIFNSRAAAVASAVVSIAVGFLRGFEILPNEMWTVCFGYLAFVLFLCFWQRIRRVMCRPWIVFVDKLCIAQHNEDLKEQGILSLAGFIDHSKKLTILWSPRYFNRLWCTYEIAAFLRNQVFEEKPLQVMPVKMAAVLFLLSICWHLLTISFYVLEAALEDESGMTDEIFVGGFVSAYLWLSMPFVCYVGTGLMQDIQELPRQLKTFRVQESKCFCCTNNHIHPETGRRIICDRKLVFKTLRKWFGSSSSLQGLSFRGSQSLPVAGSKHERHLDAFNHLVQNDLAPTVLKTVGGDTLPFSYAVYIVSCCNVPFLAQYIGVWKVERHKYEGFDQFAWSARLFMDWATLSLVILCSVRACMYLWRLGFQWAKSRSRILVSFLLVPLLNGFIAAAWLPVQLTRVFTDQVSLWPVIPFACLIALTAYLYASSFVWLDQGLEAVSNMVRMVSETGSCDLSDSGRFWSRSHGRDSSESSAVRSDSVGPMSPVQSNGRSRSWLSDLSDTDLDQSPTDLDQDPDALDTNHGFSWNVTKVDSLEEAGMNHKSEGESSSRVCHTWSTASHGNLVGLPEVWSETTSQQSIASVTSNRLGRLMS